jgi:hypothetical protein
VSPSTSLYPFDGYQWLRDGGVIAGQTGPSYTPTSGDVGHQLACAITGTYAVPFLVTVSGASAAITVQAVPVPKLSGLQVSPHAFKLTGRRVGRHCAKATRTGRHCRRAVKLRVSFTLSIPASVTFKVEKVLAGRRVKGRCVAPTRRNRRHRHCVRVRALRGTITHSGAAGSNHFIFSGKLGRHKLGPGSYRLVGTPSAGGVTGTRLSAGFRLVR